MIREASSQINSTVFVFVRKESIQSHTYVGAPGGAAASALAGAVICTVETAVASCFWVTVIGVYFFGVSVSKPLLYHGFFWTSSSVMRIFGSVTSIFPSKNLVSFENLQVRILKVRNASL